MRPIRLKWWGVILVAVLGGSGCAGIILEKPGIDGTTERMRLGTTPKWSLWDHSPSKGDDSSLILKKESTF